MTTTQCWKCEVENEKWAEQSSDGKIIQCLPCLGQSNAKTDGVVTSKRPYDDSRWNQHKEGKGHNANVAFKEAVVLLDPDAPRRKYKSQPLSSFFKVVKRATNIPVPAVDSVVVADSAVAVVDMASEEQTSR